jgi:hypothetical protein
MQSLGGSGGIHEVPIWHAFRFVPVHRCERALLSGGIKRKGALLLFRLLPTPVGPLTAPRSTD